MRTLKSKGSLLVLIVTLSLSTVLAQNDANEPCSKDEDCKGYCVTVTVKGSKKKVCASCNQSTLDSYTRDVNRYCKDEGWSVAKSKDYKEALADDDRAEVGVFDVMIDKCKSCLKARSTREDKCFDGGDDTHEGKVEEMEDSRDRWVQHKYNMIRDKRVFYTDKRTYNDLIKEFNTYCQSKLNLTKFEQDLKIAERAVDKDDDSECEDILEYEDACYDCYQAAKNLYAKAFKSSKSVMPSDYLKIYEQIIELEETFEAVKNECD